MPTEIKLPPLSENLSEGGVLELRVKPGDAVKVGDVVAVIEAEKSTIEVTADQAGTVAAVLVKKGDTVKVGQPLLRLEGGASSASKAPPPAKEPAPVEPADHARRTTAATASKAPTAVAPGRNGNQQAGPRATHVGRPVPAGPATRRLANKLGIDLGSVPGSGPRGRVTQDDVIVYSRRSSPLTGGVAVPPLPDFGKWGEVEVLPLELIRRKTAEQMSVAWSQVPHVTQHDIADVTDLEAFRKTQDGKGPKLTVTAFAIKAVAVALKEFPQFNASLDVVEQRLIRKHYYHIGVAVDTDRGLLVPIVRDVDRKSVREIAADLADVAERARQRKISVDDIKGGTFTVTNLGGIGGTAFTPIVNWPEVAILGMSRLRLEPVVRDGQVVPRLILPLSLSYDHRVIDGADGARFTRRIAQMLDTPMLLLLDA